MILVILLLLLLLLLILVILLILANTANTGDTADTAAAAAAARWITSNLGRGIFVFYFRVWDYRCSSVRFVPSLSTSRMVSMQPRQLHPINQA